MSDQELDRLMERLLLDSMKPEPEDADEAVFTPSRRYERSMRSLLKDPVRWAGRQARPMWRRGLQRAAVVLLVCAVGFGCVMAVSPDVRAAIMRWTVEIYENDIVYRYSGEPINEGIPLYEITDLPEGYVESVSERIETPTYISLKYRNKNDKNAEWIRFSYTYMQEGTISGFVTENTDIFPVTVNGMEGQLFLSRDLEISDNTVTWIDPNRNIQFDVSASVDKDSLLRMAESVSLTRIMPQYEITDLPEGYVEDVNRRVEGPSYTYITYINEELQKAIYFDCVYMQQGSLIDFRVEDADILPVTVNGMEGTLFLAKDPETCDNTVTWIDPDQNLQFDISAFADKDSLLRMAESVSLVKTEK